MEKRHLYVDINVLKVHISTHEFTLSLLLRIRVAGGRVSMATHDLLCARFVRKYVMKERRELHSSASLLLCTTCNQRKARMMATYQQPSRVWRSLPGSTASTTLRRIRVTGDRALRGHLMVSRREDHPQKLVSQGVWSCEAHDPDTTVNRTAV